MSSLEQPQSQETNSLPSELKYPQDKDTAGSQFWGVIHNIAAKYPNHPTDIDKKKARGFLSYLISHFVCQDCVREAAEYIKNNRIDYSSRNSLSEYFCKMHNAVNERLGKPTVDCDSILDGHSVVSHDNTTCTTCNVKKEGDIKTNLEDFKKSARNIVLSICREESIAPPNIHFQPCPDKASTSCITYDSGRIKEGVYFGDADIYINPYSASLRTVIHETKHYVDLKKGRSLGEVDADNYAIDKINQHFTFDTYKNEPAVNAVHMDETTNRDLLPITNDVFDKKPNPISVGDLSTKYDYPSLNRLNGMLDERIQKAASDRVVEGRVAEPVENKFIAENNNDFILSSLNSVFAWPASLVGVSPSSLNMQYTGSFITQVIMYLINSNLSTFGAAMVGFVGSVGLFTGSAIFKGAISQGDRGFIQGIVSMFLTSGINSLTPAKRGVMGEGLRLLIEGVKTFDLMKIKEAFFFDDEAFKLNKSINGEGAKQNGKPHKIDPKTGYRNDAVANALAASVGPADYKTSMDVSPIRGMQLASQRQFDASNPSNYMTGDKNTVPNYSNSTLESIANSYARKRSIFGGGTPVNNLEGIDMDQLADELGGLADMEVDSNTYEVLQL